MRYINSLDGRKEEGGEEEKVILNSFPVCFIVAYRTNSLEKFCKKTNRRAKRTKNPLDNTFFLPRNHREKTRTYILFPPSPLPSSPPEPMHLSATHPNDPTSPPANTPPCSTCHLKQKTPRGNFETALSYKHGVPTPRTTGLSDLSCRKLDLHAD